MARSRARPRRKTGRSLGKIHSSFDMKQHGAQWAISSPALRPRVRHERATLPRVRVGKSTLEGVGRSTSRLVDMSASVTVDKRSCLLVDKWSLPVQVDIGFQARSALADVGDISEGGSAGARLRPLEPPEGFGMSVSVRRSSRAAGDSPCPLLNEVLRGSIMEVETVLPLRRGSRMEGRGAGWRSWRRREWPRRQREIGRWTGSKKPKSAMPAELVGTSDSDDVRKSSHPTDACRSVGAERNRGYQSGHPVRTRFVPADGAGTDLALALVAGGGSLWPVERLQRLVGASRFGQPGCCGSKRTAGLPAVCGDRRPLWGRLPFRSAGVAGDSMQAAGSPAACCESMVPFGTSPRCSAWRGTPCPGCRSRRLTALNEGRF